MGTLKHLALTLSVLTITACGQGFSSKAVEGSASSASTTSLELSATSTPIWTNDQLSVQKFTLTFDATPSASAQAGEDAVIGVSNGVAQSYTDLAAIVRFSANGIDARNGGAYASLVNVPYTSGLSYHIEMDVDVVKHQYDVYVTSPGGAKTQIASAYSFRTEQAAVSNITNFAYYADGGGIAVSNIGIVINVTGPASPAPSPSPAPAPGPTPTPAPAPTPAPSANCPKGGYQDGCAQNASGSIRLSTLLSGYKATPPWNVAGVDYAVGIPSGLKLKDPRSAALPSGCSLSGSTITCAGNLTLDGFDFSLHNGTTLNITGGNVTVQNSLFIVGSNQGALGKILEVSGSTKASFLHNEFNGANIAVTVQQGQMINIENQGTTIFQYNYFHNTGGDMIDFSGGPRAEIVQYNLFKDIGLNTDHSDTLQWCGSLTTSADIGFNVMDQSVAGLSGMGLLEPNSECDGSNMSNMLVHNNTLISKVQDNFLTGVDVTQDAGAAKADHVAVFDNYADASGVMSYTKSPWFPTGYYGSTLAHPSAMHSLIDMSSGSALTVPSKTNNQASDPYYVYPDASGYTPGLSDLYSVSASPSSGTLAVGSTVVFSLSMAEAWTVTGTPLLALNNGAVAKYSGGSGTNTLLFSYTVGTGNGSTSALAITAVNLNGGSVKDVYGNTANLAGAVSTFSGLSVSASSSAQTTPTTPAAPVPTTTVSTQAPASTITHGSQLTLAMVGPAAIGITPKGAVGATSVEDGGSYSFAQKISGPATYDGFTVSGPHLLIQGVAFTGTLDIYTTQTVVVRGCSFRSPAIAANLMIRDGAGKVYVLYNDAGSDDPGPSPNTLGNTGTNSAHSSNTALNDSGTAGAIFYRNHVSAARIGIQPSSNAQVIENYVDNFVYYQGEHTDGIMVDGSTNTGIRILRNKVLVNEGETCALCIMPDFANASDIVADSNYLAGGSYAIYGGENSFGPVTGFKLVNNVIGTDFYPLGGQYGYLSSWAVSSSTGGNYWCNNTLSGSVLTGWQNGYPAGAIPTADCSQLH